MCSISRKTRSGAAFSPWDGPHVTATDPSFDFPELLKKSMERAQAAERDHFDSFSLSPLSSPESSRTSSPTPSPATLQPEPSSLDDPRTSPPSPMVLEIPTSQPADRNKKKKRQGHTCRSKKRAKEREARFSPYEARPAVKAKYVDQATSVHTSASVETSRVASTAYVALDDRVRSKKVYALHELVGPGSKLGFILQEWDGVTPIPILDREGRLVAILAGCPTDDSWPELSRQGARLLEEARGRCNIPAKCSRHRRGQFAALRCGVSHGGGQTVPGNLRNESPNDEVLEELNQKDPFTRMSGFATSVLATWMPDLHKYYADTLEALHNHDPSLKRIFPTSVFSATTYNLGPRTICFKHTDFANLAFGMCAVTALGEFNPKEGGHLILWECGLVIEFPPGSTILIPSATVAHSNVAISRHERRYSFTQYTAAGLFRWVENGFQKSDRFYASLSPEELARQQDKDAHRWAWGLSLLPQFTTSHKPAAA